MGRARNSEMVSGDPFAGLWGARRGGQQLDAAAPSANSRHELARLRAQVADGELDEALALLVDYAQARQRPPLLDELAGELAAYVQRSMSAGQNQMLDNLHTVQARLQVSEPSAPGQFQALVSERLVELLKTRAAQFVAEPLELGQAAGEVMRAAAVECCADSVMRAPERAVQILLEREGDGREVGDGYARAQATLRSERLGECLDAGAWQRVLSSQVPRIGAPGSDWACVQSARVLYAEMLAAALAKAPAREDARRVIERARALELALSRHERWQIDRDVRGEALHDESDGVSAMRLTPGSVITDSVGLIPTSNTKDWSARGSGLLLHVGHLVARDRWSSRDFAVNELAPVTLAKLLDVLDGTADAVELPGEACDSSITRRQAGSLRLERSHEGYTVTVTTPEDAGEPLRAGLSGRYLRLLAGWLAEHVEGAR